MLLRLSKALQGSLKTVSVDAVGLSTTSDIPLPNWTPELSLAYMDKFDIAGAILSLSSPGIPYGDMAEACTMARQVGSASPNKHTVSSYGRMHASAFWCPKFHE